MCRRRKTGDSTEDVDAVTKNRRLTPLDVDFQRLIKQTLRKQGLTMSLEGRTEYADSALDTPIFTILMPRVA